jgi:myo-inositol-1-phosphate synthase
MSPTAINVPGHHDSFALPAQNNGAAVSAPVHASARRAPEGGLIKVEGDDVVYEAEGVRAKFTDRGADVTSELTHVPLSREDGETDDLAEGADGRLKVVKTEKKYEFFTKSKVGKVG